MDPMSVDDSYNKNTFYGATVGVFFFSYMSNFIMEKHCDLNLMKS